MIQITDRTCIEFFLDERQEEALLGALDIESFDEINRAIEVALIVAYGAGFEDGEFVGGMK